MVPLGPLKQGILETPGHTVTGHLVHGQVKEAPLGLCDVKTDFFYKILQSAAMNKNMQISIQHFFSRVNALYFLLSWLHIDLFS